MDSEISLDAPAPAPGARHRKGAAPAPRLLHLVPLFILLLATGCSSDWHRPAAVLSLTKIEKTQIGFDVAFTSNVDLDGLYPAGEGSSVVSRRLVCAAGDDQNFAVAHFMREYFSGSIETPAGARPNNGPYRYIAAGRFHTDSANGSNSLTLEGEQLAALLRQRATLPCMIVMTVFPRKPYYSSILRIPSARFVDASIPPD